MAAMVVGALRRGTGCGVVVGFRCGSRHLARSLRRFASTLVVAEHEGGLVKPSSLSALAAAEAIGKENKVSVLLGGSGPALHKAADHAASSHPLVSEKVKTRSIVLQHPLPIGCFSSAAGARCRFRSPGTSFGRIMGRATSLCSAERRLLSCHNFVDVFRKEFASTRCSSS